MREKNGDEFNSQNSPHTHMYPDTLARSAVSSLESYVGKGGKKDLSFSFFASFHLLFPSLAPFLHVCNSVTGSGCLGSVMS